MTQTQIVKHLSACDESRTHCTIMVFSLVSQPLAAQHGENIMTQTQLPSLFLIIICSLVLFSGNRIGKQVIGIVGLVAVLLWMML